MQLRALKQYKQKENRSQFGQSLKKTTTLLASQRECDQNATIENNV